MSAAARRVMNRRGILAKWDSEAAAEKTTGKGAADQCRSRRRSGAVRPWLDILQKRRRSGFYRGPLLVHSRCRGGRPARAASLGIMHHFGQGTPQSYPLAAKWIKRAADGQPDRAARDWTDAAERPGCRKGRSARGELEKAVAAGVQEAMVSLGLALYHGRGVEQDWRRGKELVAAAAAARSLGPRTLWSTSGRETIGASGGGAATRGGRRGGGPGQQKEEDQEEEEEAARGGHGGARRGEGRRPGGRGGRRARNQGGRLAGPRAAHARETSLPPRRTDA